MMCSGTSPMREFLMTQISGSQNGLQAEKLISLTTASIDISMREEVTCHAFSKSALIQVKKRLIHTKMSETKLAD